jgi:hypothetical protein
MSGHAVAVANLLANAIEVVLLILCVTLLTRIDHNTRDKH